MLHQPKPKKPLSLNQAYNLRHNQNQNQNYNHNHGHSQKYPAIDEKSESSMDSLLDEYEENIHKSMTIALRPQSRQPSIVSAHHKRLPATHYNRSHYNNQGNLNDDGVAQYYPTETRTQQFPQSNNGHNRSRRSSKVICILMRVVGWNPISIVKLTIITITIIRKSQNLAPPTVSIVLQLTYIKFIKIFP